MALLSSKGLKDQLFQKRFLQNYWKRVTLLSFQTMFVRVFPTSSVKWVIVHVNVEPFDKIR